MIMLDGLVTAAYYAMTALFGVVLLRNFFRTRNAQDAVLYCIILVPFVLRLLRVK